MSDRLITKISVTGLFGLYDYSLPKSGALEDAAILYGDNGIGKSTVLRLAFHLLSAADNKGHRTNLYNSEFESISVTLTSGIVLDARREKEGVLALRVLSGKRTLALWEYKPREISEGLLSLNFEIFKEKIIHQHSLRKKPNIKNYGEDAYLATLSTYVPNLFLLNADRRLYSDTISDPSDEMEIRKLMNYEGSKKIQDMAVRSRQIGLSQAMNNAARWIAKKALQGVNEGDTNVHAVYGQVLQHLVNPSKVKSSEEAYDTELLIKRLNSIEARTIQLSTYEFATPLSMSDFKKPLTSRYNARKSLAASLLKPYIESIEGRLRAVEPIYELVNNFVETLNKFLYDKSIEFKVGSGFSLKNKKGLALEPAQLSSGEQQLLLLFCHILTARDRPTIFMIDEPEISLNIKWQRQLVQSLLDITSGAKIQFLFASHSLELLSQHRKRVIKLESANE